MSRILYHALVLVDQITWAIAGRALHARQDFGRWTEQPEEID